MGLKPIRIFSILLLALFASATLPILAMLNSSPRSLIQLLQLPRMMDGNTLLEV